jgi:hypothetical protein
MTYIDSKPISKIRKINNVHAPIKSWYTLRSLIPNLHGLVILTCNTNKIILKVYTITQMHVFISFHNEHIMRVWPWGQKVK